MSSELKIKIQKHQLLPLIVLLTGVLFSLYLQWQIPKGLFLSGDGGLKFLLTKQFSTGMLQFNLDLPTENWVKNLWQEGFYPFRPPFVYNLFNKYYITFPFTFPAVTAPLYALFGFQGLNILPLGSIWALWLTFYWVCQRLEIDSSKTAIALIVLIFASPLTIYSGAYWEHTLAIALAFGGIAIVFQPIKKLSKKKVIISGILIGLSVWFREELLCLVAALLLISLIIFIQSIREKNPILRHQVIWFLSSLLLTTFLFFGLNFLVYGHPLGTHSFQVVADFSLSERLKGAFENFKKLSYDFFYYFPIAFFVSFYLLLAIFHPHVKLTNTTKALLLIVVIFALSLPLILPAAEGISLESRTGGKQWGPRFLLILIPILSLLTALALQAITTARNSSLKYTTAIFFSALLVVGIHLNSYSGVAFLSSTRKVLPLLNYLQLQPISIIAISHQYVAQTLPTLFDRKVFFLAEKSEDVKKLAITLQKQGYNKFLYICYPYSPCQPAEEMAGSSTAISANQRYMIEFSSSEVLSKYPLYEVSVREAS